MLSKRLKEEIEIKSAELKPSYEGKILNIEILNFNLKGILLVKVNSEIIKVVI